MSDRRHGSDRGGILVLVEVQFVWLDHHFLVELGRARRGDLKPKDSVQRSPKAVDALAPNQRPDRREDLFTGDLIDPLKLRE